MPHTSFPSLVSVSLALYLDDMSESANGGERRIRWKGRTRVHRAPFWQLHRWQITVPVSVIQLVSLANTVSCLLSVNENERATGKLGERRYKGTWKQLFFQRMLMMLMLALRSFICWLNCLRMRQRGLPSLLPVTHRLEVSRWSRQSSFSLSVVKLKLIICSKDDDIFVSLLPSNFRFHLWHKLAFLVSLWRALVFHYFYLALLLFSFHVSFSLSTCRHEAHTRTLSWWHSLRSDSLSFNVCERSSSSILLITTTLA